MTPLILSNDANILPLRCVQCGTNMCAVERPEPGTGICTRCIQKNFDKMLDDHTETPKVRKINGA